MRWWCLAFVGCLTPAGSGIELHVYLKLERCLRSVTPTVTAQARKVVAGTSSQNIPDLTGERVARRMMA